MAKAMENASRTIHLVFKTHLDIGFTDHAEKVRRQYHERFLPQAIETGTHFFREDPADPAFVWTTGAWLIWDHLDTQPKDKARRLEQAIERGLIRWHALPFTTHSELMTPALFRAGLSYAAELDKRFGVKTVAAKMTDVPGHTRGIVPLLAEAGVKFLHLGVNAASRVPDVPDVFRWRAPGGAEIVVMYQNSYGATHFPAGFADGLSFAHTNDNQGPQSVGQTAEVYRALRREYPDAVIRAATLDDYAERLWERRAEFPLVELEIGDSWIHGVASDPKKTQAFLALQRLHETFALDKLTRSRLAFGRRLAMVAEHTWGVDIKSFLRDETAWDRPAFAAARHADYRFAFTEASWAEQRAYVDEAVAALHGADKAAARRELADLKVPARAKATPASVTAKPTTLHGWSIEVDPVSGDILELTSPDGIALAGRNGTLLGCRHETYGAADMTRYRESYITQPLDWALLDFDKPGLATATTARSMRWLPRLTESAKKRGTLILGLEFPELARAELGAPRRLELLLRPVDDSRLDVTVVLRDKPANRMPEAGFLLLTPAGAETWDYHKMGLWQSGAAVAANAGGHLQAVTAVRSLLPDGRSLLVEPLDTPLVAPAIGDFMSYDPAPPDLSQGLRFNLYNNRWGTNFPMWWEGSFKARYVISVGEAKG
ncbi:MAG: DUF5054 domain-containing protein [Devosia sp.]|nr:DUF5054 domain-containing protein [Devosia sp.]